MEHYPILDRIEKLSDLRTLNEWELRRLCYEIRSFLIEHVSRTGGHLASNLGAVELTVALHRVFDSPRDSIVWDVGHQSYTHKILTGRRNQFDTLRQRDGLSGFPKPEESVHDAFVAGHASTSISAAYGIACANALSGDPHTAVAVVGDGAFTGGMIYEAINNAGRSGVRLVIVLNHNDMSISKNVGAFARYLSTIRAKPGYLHFKQHVESVLDHLPLIGAPLKHALRQSKSVLKYILFHNTFFEEMGLEYYGPVDGHNLAEMEQVMTRAKNLGRPAVIQVETVKGKGYPFAEKDPPAYHGVSCFDVDTGSPDGAPVSESFSAVFGQEMEALAAREGRVCAITAAMAVGTGLEPFSRIYRSRFFDVGIAEEHAVTFAAGLAVKGYLPVFAVYSTFFQRCFDQVLHDAALERTHIVLAIDRAGIIGDDGDTHQGIFDVALLTTIPGVKIYSPASFAQLRADLDRAVLTDTGVVAIRYPRGGENPHHCTLGADEDDTWLEGDRSLTAVSYGRTAAALCEAADELENPPERVLLNRVWPFPDELLKVLAKRTHILFFEEAVRSGGIAEHLLTALNSRGFTGKYEAVTLPDEFIRQSSVPWALDHYGLSAEKIRARLTEAMKAEERMR